MVKHESTISVTHISYTGSGGAGFAARALSTALTERGVNSTMFEFSASSVTDAPLRHPAVTAAAVLDHLLISSRDSSLFSLLRGHLGRFPAIGPSIVHLHWTWGAISTKSLLKVLDERQVVWTLHDFRPLTGGCHYPLDCAGFLTSCQTCPQARTLFHSAVSAQKRLQREMLDHENLTLISPSEGLREAAMAAGARNVVRIPNVIDGKWFTLSGPPKDSGTHRLNFIFVATNLSDPIKGLDLVLQWWVAGNPRLGTLNVVGSANRTLNVTDDSVTFLGHLESEHLKSYFDKADVLVFASLQDNAPGVIAEAVSRDLPILCLNQKMLPWLQADHVPLVSEGELRSSEKFLKFKKEIFEPMRKKFLADRTPHHVVEEHLKIYRNLKKVEL